MGLCNPSLVIQARHPFVLDERKNRKPLQMSAPVGIFKDPYQRGQGDPAPGGTPMAAGPPGVVLN